MKKTFTFNDYVSLSVELSGNIFDLEPNDGLFVNALLKRIFEYENE